MNEETNDEAFIRILALVRKEAGVDFSHYKMPTIKRRIGRRMLFHRLKTTSEYAELLAAKKDEIQLLCQEMLIHVTEFFRDNETHQYLSKELFPKLLSAKKNGEPLRIWIAACATGEEAYSMAISILEILEANSQRVPVQIFATDVSSSAVKKARLAEYTAKSVETVSPKRLQHFFTKVGNNYRINKSVRDLCVFAPHNILSDPPFSHVDFISCRNMLIYLDSAAQKKAISTFHYALNGGGFLMLGKSETVGSSALQFNQVNKKFKIYLRKNMSGAQRLPELFPRSKPIPAPLKNIAIKTAENKQLPEKGFSGNVDAILLAHYIPASVVINQYMEILQFKGPTEQYLKHSTGKASLNLLKMTPPEVALELRLAIPKVMASGKGFRKTNIEIKHGPDYRIMNIEMVPLMFEWDEPLFLVLFTRPEKLPDPVSTKTGKNDSIKDQRIQKLQTDLARSHENILLFTKEQESFTDELQSANEEAVSSNEELQSLNEELETSKEEIESSNEELITSNQELITRNQLLNESYEYSEAIIHTIHEPLVVLDKDLRIKSVNNAFYRNFKLTEAETVGTLFYQLGNKQFAIPKLRKLLNSIIQKDTSVNDFEIKSTFPGVGEKSMLLNAGRIVQKSNGVKLILLAIHDITDKMLLIQRENRKLLTTAAEKGLQNEKLEILVIERTAALTHANKLLEENLESLEKINEELEAFAFVSSHDLQEPLRKIQTFAGMIMENDFANLSETGKEYFDKIQAAAKRMRTLIQDLISYSELNSIERAIKKSDLAEIVTQVITELEDTILEKKAVITTDIKGTVNIIPFQFRQLMHNLLGNAFKFAKPGIPPHISIRSSIVKSCALNLRKNDNIKKPCCHISITDNGIGFDQKYEQRIFSVFQKLHEKDEFEGSGIGLAIVKKIIQNHNGTISATSKPGEGTTFNILIPI